MGERAERGRERALGGVVEGAVGLHQPAAGHADVGPRVHQADHPVERAGRDLGVGVEQQHVAGGGAPQHHVVGDAEAGVPGQRLELRPRGSRCGSSPPCRRVLALSTTWVTIGPDSSGCWRSDSRQARTCSRAPSETTITISSRGSAAWGAVLAGCAEVGSAAIDRDPAVANAHDAPPSYRERADIREASPGACARVAAISRRPAVA